MWLPNRAEALDFLRTHLTTDSLVRHCIATEAIMRTLAGNLGEDENLWGITGLFHDIDLDLVSGDLARHGLAAADLLRGKDFPEEGINAILAHNGDILGFKLVTRFDHALLAAETTTGLIVAAALVQPSRLIREVNFKSLKRRMKEKRFAAGVDREKILEIEKIGISLDDFLQMSLDSMMTVAGEIGL